MRLWHYKLIPFLPNSQLIAQWRELNSIFKKQPKHILINYVYDYPQEDLNLYANYIIIEMRERGISISNNSMDNYFEYFYNSNNHAKLLTEGVPFPNHHTNRYLLQCFYNLQEKYDRGQKDFSKEQYYKLVKFMENELAWSEIDFYEIH